MMNTIIKGSFWVFCSFLFLAVCFVPQGVFAGPPAGGPPFMAGQVVVHGTPDTLPAGYSVVKVLPHAKLTVVAVEPGKEFGHLQSLRAKGYRAGLNLKMAGIVAKAIPCAPIFTNLRLVIGPIRHSSGSISIGLSFLVGACGVAWYYYLLTCKPFLGFIIIVNFCKRKPFYYL